MSFLVINVSQKEETTGNTIYLKFFTNRDDAIEYVMDKCHDDLTYNHEYACVRREMTNLEERLDIVRQIISEGKAVWTWERKRKKAGDFYRIDSIENPSEYCIQYHLDESTNA